MANQQIKAASLIILWSLMNLLLTGCINREPSFAEDDYKSGPPQSAISIDNTITRADITRDVNYLASDALNGRGNFSVSINEAADYIAKRFNDVGLLPSPNTLNFKQQYTVQRTVPYMVKVTINGQAIDNKHLSMVTSALKIDWNQSSKPVNTVFINEDENLRKSLRKLNYQGGQHLVLLHPKHQKSFKRYQSHFANGLTKLIGTDEKSRHSNPISHNATHNNQAGTIVIVLADIDAIDSYTVQGSATVTDTRLSNVIGVLPGKSKADEIVLFSAHYDHLGGSDENIFNGADDNASGVSAIINLANYYSKSDLNERTLMFSAFSAEELGGFGSQYFSSQISPENITAMVNIEMIGKPAVFGSGSVWMTGMNRSNLGELLNQSIADKQLRIYEDPYPNQKLFYRSDNASLARLGVPAHSFSSAQIDKDEHYHKVSDDITSLNIPSMLKVIKTLAIATTPLAEGSITPSRIDPSKVKAKGLIY